MLCIIQNAPTTRFNICSKCLCSLVFFHKHTHWGKETFSVRPCNPSNSVCFMSFILLFNLLSTNDSQLWCHLYGYQTETYKIINGTIKVPERMQKTLSLFFTEKSCYFEYALRLWCENRVARIYHNKFCHLVISSIPVYLLSAQSAEYDSSLWI